MGNRTHTFTLAVFKAVGHLEGLFLALLLGVAMPLKYVFAMPLAARWLGWIHGLFFLTYIALLAVLASEHGWPTRKSTLGFFSALIPLGTCLFVHSLGTPHPTPPPQAQPAP